MPEEDADGRQRDDAGEVDRIVLPAHQQTATPLHLREEPFDDPPSFVAAQAAAVLSLTPNDAP
jgi:hypothetical protein